MTMNNVTHSDRPAIVTTHHAKTGTRDSTIFASAGSALQICFPCDEKMSIQENCASAALALCEEMAWFGELRSGKTEHGYVFVFV
jgi:hypothetical protein